MYGHKALFSPTLLLILCFYISYSLWKFDVESLPIDSDQIHPSLYSFQDNIKILFSSNITASVTEWNRDKIHLIQFYNSYCGHCQQFAPRFKEFARSIHKWNPLVEISVLNCADDENTDACQTYDIRAYPTLRLFWHQSRKIDHGTNFPSWCFKKNLN